MTLQVFHATPSSFIRLSLIELFLTVINAWLAIEKNYMIYLNLSPKYLKSNSNVLPGQTGSALFFNFTVLC